MQPAMAWLAVAKLWWLAAMQQKAEDSWLVKRNKRLMAAWLSAVSSKHLSSIMWRKWQWRQM
jgi:hypothetical protein